MAITLAIYASLFLGGVLWKRSPSAAEEDHRTAEEIQAAREAVERRHVQMIYLPPVARQRQARPAPTPPRLPPNESKGNEPPDPQSDPIRALRSPIADPGGDAARLGEGAEAEKPNIAPPRPVPLALNPGPSAPAPAEPAPSSAAPTGTRGGIQLGPRLGITPRDPRPWSQSMPSTADSCPVVMPDSTKPGEPRMGSASGRVLKVQGGGPMPNAHLQIIGTSFVTFTDNNGEYTLTFDASLLDQCRTQYVRVSAPGYEPRLLVLVIGRNIRSDDVALRRN
ncbi:MAG TPA: hypothetical protein VFV65_02300 [Gemmatimonadales bacterium]|nr:hypothetical protein [Gemmatimonadales bacterium]